MTPSLRRGGRSAFTDPDLIDPVIWIQRVKTARLPLERVAVAQELAVYADFGASREARPITVSVTRSNRHIRRLRRGGWLAVTTRGPRGVVVYALTLPRAV